MSGPGPTSLDIASITPYLKKESGPPAHIALRGRCTVARFRVARQDLDNDPALLQQAQKCYDYTLKGRDLFQVADIVRLPPENVRQLLSALAEYRSYVAPDPNIAARVSLLDAQIDAWIVRLNQAYDSPVINEDGSPTESVSISQAINAFARLAKLKIQIGGMAAPSRTELTITTHADADSIDSEIRSLTAKLNLNEVPE